MSRKRSIFEDVSEASSRSGTSASGTATGLIDAGRNPAARRAARLWLMLLFGLVVLMIAVGGMTRLTDSGLSITEWRPVTGALPPLSAEAWQAEFDLYRQIPQYQIVNRGMSLEEFKVIYWWEWGHRQFGRLIGLVWGLGLALLWWRGLIPRGWGGRFLLLGALGGLQGAIGWWMVASGLREGMIAVASTRLAIHLGLAFVILGLISWWVMTLSRSESQLIQARRGREARLFSGSTGLMHFAFLQILLGALVAGIDAGRGFTDWPLMNGRVFPEGAFDLVPLWTNFTENPGLVQFIHRTAGYLLAIFAVVVWLRARRSVHAATRGAGHAMLAMMALQVGLGIAAILTAAAWQVAILHQFGAVVLWVLVLRLRHRAQYPVVAGLRGKPA